MTRDVRQQRLTEWARAAFGTEEVDNLPQRGLRLLEEATEAFQACGGNAEMAHKLVDYVFGRSIGILGQELGGVAVCLLVLAEVAGLSADDEEAREMHRVLSKPIEHFAARNAAKNADGLLVRALACHKCNKPLALVEAWFDSVNNRYECGPCWEQEWNTP